MMAETLNRLDLDEVGSRRLKHEQLKTHLVDAMISGQLKPGQALPSENRLSKQLGMTRVTIRQAMASLENDGLIRRVQGKGNFVEADARQKLKRGLDLFALLVPETRSSYYPSLLHGFANAASDIQHQTIICDTENEVLRQGDIILQLMDKNVGGVAMVPTSQPLTPGYQVRQLQNHGIPVVFCHRGVKGVKAPLLAMPVRVVGCLAGKALAEHGHRRVAMIDSHRTSVLQSWEEGLREAMQTVGNSEPITSVCVSDSIVMREEDILAALHKVFDQPNPPTGLFVGFDSLAEMIYLLLPRLGLSVPEDVSLVGFGGMWREGAITRRLTSVVVDEIATGQQAVSLLHEMRDCDRPIDDNEEFVMALDLYKGETLALLC